MEKELNSFLNLSKEWYARQNKWSRLELTNALINKALVSGKKNIVPSPQAPTSGYVSNFSRVSYTNKPPASTPTPNQTPAETSALKPEATKPKIFSDPSIFKVEAKSGESVWSILEKILNQSEDFRAIFGAKRTYILGIISDKVVRDPSKYGLKQDGNLRIGDKLDFSEVFNNEQKIRELIDRKLSLQQETSILENEKKLKDLMNKSVKKELPIAPVSVQMPKPVPKTQEPTVLPKALKDKFSQKAETMPESIKPSLYERDMPRDVAFSEAVNEAFKNDIDSIYGKKGLIGLGSKNGVDTDEWIYMALLPAKLVVDFSTSNSESDSLPKNIRDTLTKTPSHIAMISHINELLRAAGGAVRPYQNEVVADFLKRLGKYVMENYKK